MDNKSAPRFRRLNTELRANSPDLDRQLEAERIRRLREESPDYRERILPETCFPDTVNADPRLPPGTTGAHSGALRGFAAGSCCGWRQPPTGQEIHSALQAAAPDRRQLAILAALTAELPPLEMIRAVREGACSLRQLARAVSAHGLRASQQVGDHEPMGDRGHPGAPTSGLIPPEPSRQLDIDGVEVDVAHALEQLGGPDVDQDLDPCARQPRRGERTRDRRLRARPRGPRRGRDRSAARPHPRPARALAVGPPSDPPRRRRSRAASDTRAIVGAPPTTGRND